MKRNLSVIIIFAGLVLLAAAGAEAVTTVDPMDTAGGARPWGMGGAYTAVADDPNVLFLNPAGLNDFKSWAATWTSIYLSHTGTSYTILGAGGDTPYGKLGFGYVGSMTGGVNVTGETLADYTDNVFFISYARSFRSSSEEVSGLGLNFKFFNKGYSQGLGSGSGMNIDFGIKHRPNDWLTIGLLKRNILPGDMGGSIKWGTGSEEYLPSYLTLGLGFKYFKGQTVFDMDLVIPDNQTVPVTFRMGTEFKPNKTLSLRVGAAEEVGSLGSSQKSLSPTIGLGLNFRGINIDFCYRPYYVAFSDTVTSFVSISYVQPRPRRLTVIASRNSLRVGETQTVTVETAYEDIRGVSALMPDGKEIELSGGREGKFWKGQWEATHLGTGEGMVAKAILIDSDYNRWEADSNRFDVILPGGWEPPVVVPLSEVGSIEGEEADIFLPEEEDLPGGKFYYKLEIGRFADRIKALKLIEKLRAQGFPATARRIKIGWRVQVGAFKNKSGAIQLRDELSEKGFESEIIIDRD